MPNTTYTFPAEQQLDLPNPLDFARRVPTLDELNADAGYESIDDLVLDHTVNFDLDLA